MLSSLRTDSEWPLELSEPLSCGNCPFTKGHLPGCEKMRANPIDTYRRQIERELRVDYDRVEPYRWLVNGESLEWPP